MADSFAKKYESLPKDEQHRIDSAKKQLALNPFSGKPLGYMFFREKKLGVKRMYYLVYENMRTVYIVAYGGKKEQPAIITEIKSKFEYFKSIIEKLNVITSILELGLP